MPNLTVISHGVATHWCSYSLIKNNKMPKIAGYILHFKIITGFFICEWIVPILFSWEKNLSHLTTKKALNQKGPRVIPWHQYCHVFCCLQVLPSLKDPKDRPVWMLRDPTFMSRPKKVTTHLRHPCRMETKMNKQNRWDRINERNGKSYLQIES